MGLKVREWRGASALTDYGAALDEFAQRQKLPITARRTWLAAWADTYRHYQPLLIALEHGDELLGLAPLALRQRGPILDVVMLGHGPTDDARLSVARPEFAEPLAEAIVDHLPRSKPWRVQLSQLPAVDPVVAGLLHRLPTSAVAPGQGMPLVEISERDPQKYLSRNARKALAKIRNRLVKLDLDPQYTWTKDPVEIAGSLPRMMEVRRERDLSLGRRPDHDDPIAARFYVDVINRHSAVGAVELLKLEFSGDLAAYICGLVDDRTFRVWDVRLAPRWAEVSAGRLATTEALAHVVSSAEYDCLDWMRGEEPYKLQSATQVIPTLNFNAWSSGHVRRMDELALTARTKIADMVKRSPAVAQLSSRAFRSGLRIYRRVRSPRL